MRISGIKTTYSAHSLRGAGVSKGAKLKVPTDVLMDYGSWKSVKTMARHYQKPLENKETRELGEILLDNHV